MPYKKITPKKAYSGSFKCWSGMLRQHYHNDGPCYYHCTDRGIDYQGESKMCKRICVDDHLYKHQVHPCDEPPKKYKRMVIPEYDATIDVVDRVEPMVGSLLDESKPGIKMADFVPMIIMLVALCYLLFRLRNKSIY